MNSLITLRWNHGGRNVCSATSQRGGKIDEVDIRGSRRVARARSAPVKIDGSGWSKLTVLTALKRARSYLYGHVIAVPGDDVERRVIDAARSTAGPRISRPARRPPRGPRTRPPAPGNRARWRARWRRSARARAAGTARRNSRRRSRAPRRRELDLEARRRAGSARSRPARRRAGQFGGQAQRPLLRNQQQLAVRVVEVALAHRAVGGVEVNAAAALQCRGRRCRPW